MNDVIQLLPDSIANQIAAGEVIQRPASAVKELLENAVDAGATEIKLIVSDAGKQLLQVIDNGKGMSETDARMAFERHATSKIKNIDDLFRIKTMGFRGEALASIAAVAQVEMKTKRAEDAAGTYIVIENSEVQLQEPCAFVNGTSISMKNLFFNVPARRNFLKSNTVEMRHIIDEFIRVAMSFPNIFFSLTSNQQQVFHLEPGTIKQRVVQILGNAYAAKLVNVKEDTDYMNIYGFVGKPDTAKKTRGDQYFFVNNRFIKSAYLNHAVNTAFGDLIAPDSFPSYVLFIDVDPTQVDINVHPTKQEIKFEDEKIMYAFVQAAIKHALAQFSIAPTLDFSLNPHIQQLDAVSKPTSEAQKHQTASSNLYQSFTQSHQAHKIEPSNKSELRHWQDFFLPHELEKKEAVNIAPSQQPANFLPYEMAAVNKPKLFQATEQSQYLQLLNTYILVTGVHGLVMVHQQLAHERILYEQYATAMHGAQMPTQKSLFPETIEVAPADAPLLIELLPYLTRIGYSIEVSSNQQFTLHGCPADVPAGNEKNSIELLLEQLKHFTSDITFSPREKLIRCMCRQLAIKAGRPLNVTEMEAIVTQLFSCNTPNISPTGSPTYVEMKEDYLDSLFSKM